MTPLPVLSLHPAPRQVPGGLGLYSRLSITSALRRSLPISEGFSKLVDLDRCYSVSRIPVDNGRELVVYNIHMSAYGNSDDAVREGQKRMLQQDMAGEVEAGNYVICGGDFNHNLWPPRTRPTLRAGPIPIPAAICRRGCPSVWTCCRRRQERLAPHPERRHPL